MDKDHPTAEAVAVLGDRIVAVGSNADVEAWHGPHTRTVDASGKLLLPGFNDSHVHFVDGGLSLDSVQLNDATSAAEFARRIGEQARKTPKGEWVTSGDWDETKWTPAAMPTKDLIDPLTSDTPVFVSATTATWHWPTRSRFGWQASRPRRRILPAASSCTMLRAIRPAR